MKNFLYILPPALLAVQSFDSLLGGYFSYIRAAILLLIVFAFYVKFTFEIDAVGRAILLFLAYTLLISFKSSDYSVTIPGYLSILVSMSFYLVAYNSVESFDDFIRFKAFFFCIPLIFIITLITYTGFGIGEAVYDSYEGIRTGEGLHHNTIYTGVLIIVLSFVLFQYSSNKSRDLLFILSMTIIIFLSLRRTAIILVIASSMTYLFMANKKQALKYFIPSIMLIILAYPIYEQPLNSAIEARSSRLSFEKKYDNESRYLEIQTITRRILTFDDINYSLFGIEYLNSFGTYSTMEFPVLPTRILHTDYAVVLHGAGIIGIISYASIILLLILKSLQYARRFGFDDPISIFIFCSLLILVLVTFSGSILNITFRTTFFILLGSVMRLAQQRLEETT
jgi:hypothetical protein